MGLGNRRARRKAAPRKGAENEARKANRDRSELARRAAHGWRGALQGFLEPPKIRLTPERTRVCRVRSGVVVRCDSA